MVWPTEGVAAELNVGGHIASTVRNAQDGEYSRSAPLVQDPSSRRGAVHSG